MYDVFKTIKQLWLALILPATVTLALLVLYEDWDVATSHTSFLVFFGLSVLVLILIAVVGTVVLFRGGGAMLLLQKLGVLGAATILVSIVTLAGAILLVLSAIFSMSKKKDRHILPF